MSSNNKPSEQEKYIPGDAHRKAMLSASEALLQSIQALKIADKGTKASAQQKLDNDFDNFQTAIDEYRHRPPHTTAEPKGVQVSYELRGHIRAAYRVLTKPGLGMADLPELTEKLLRVARGYGEIEPPPPLSQVVSRPMSYSSMKDRLGQQQGAQVGKVKPAKSIEKLENTDDEESDSSSSVSTDTSSSDESS
ncbi:hypothetical protein KCU85_g8046, partial [Aureobasidium melanogenum]